jgi:hypothetical protein
MSASRKTGYVVCTSSTKISQPVQELEMYLAVGNDSNSNG